MVGAGSIMSPATEPGYSPIGQAAPARTVHCDASHILVWLTIQPSSQPSSCNSVRVVSTQFMSSGHGARFRVAADLPG